MSLFICEKCGCVDNTACGGTYWTKNMNLYSGNNEWANGISLCIECKPSEYSDGGINKDAGKWHNEFKKKHWSKYGSKRSLLDDFNFVGVSDYFNKKILRDVDGELNET